MKNDLYSDILMNKIYRLERKMEGLQKSLEFYKKTIEMKARYDNMVQKNVKLRQLDMFAG